MLVSYNFLDGLLGYTPGSGSSNSTVGGLNDTLDPNSTLTSDEQHDTDAVSSVEACMHYTQKHMLHCQVNIFSSELRNH